MASLYELSGQYAHLLDLIDVTDEPDDLEELYRQLEALDADIADKGDAYARIVRNTQGGIDAFSAEIKRLTARKQAKERTVARLKANIRAAMEQAGARKLTTSIGAWSIQTNGGDPTVDLLDESAIPEEYLIPQPPKVDKKAIIAAYKATGEVPPGTDIYRGEHIQFR